MTLAKVEGPPALARWTGRIAIFSLVLLVVALIGHRFFGMATPILLALVKLALAGAVASIVLALVAAIVIWRNGGPGAARVFTALVVGAGMLAWPLSYYPAMSRLPLLNDVTTSFDAPPQFEAVAAVRAAPANGTGYNRAAFAERQRQAYPDLKSLDVERSVDETFDLVVDAVKRQKIEIVQETPPTEENGRVGLIEGVDRTLIIGFRDDVAVRVVGNDAAARIDIRSASRFGRHDFGRNAMRVRDLLREIVVRLESTIPGAAENRRKRKRGKGEDSVKPRKGADRKKADPRR